MADLNTWVLVADSSHATLVEADRDLERWRLLRDIDHPDGRSKESELTRGSRGRTSPRNRDAARRAAMAPPTSPQQVEIERFSRELAELLQQGYDHDQFIELMLVAPPEFLGLLRAAIPDTVRGCVTDEIGKNLTKERPTELMALLRDSRHTH